MRMTDEDRATIAAIAIMLPVAITLMALFYLKAMHTQPGAASYELRATQVVEAPKCSELLGADGLYQLKRCTY